jgi:hypothetical protein
MPISDYVEPQLISARFILAVLIIGGFLFGKVDQTIAVSIIAFYFASQVVKQVNLQTKINEEVKASEVAKMS